MPNNNMVLACGVQFVYTYSRSQSVCLKMLEKSFPAIIVYMINRDRGYLGAHTNTHTNIITYITFDMNS